jgi:hypothetical protein
MLFEQREDWSIALALIVPTVWLDSSRLVAEIPGLEPKP